MTDKELRAWYAGLAMQALISRENKEFKGKEGVPVLARYAVEYADTMLQELTTKVKETE